MRTLLLGFLIAFSAHSADYELLGFEASDYRDWTTTEMHERLGADAGYLVAYQCNEDSQDEAPFWEPPHMQNSALQLRLRAQSGDEYTYQQGLITDSQGGVLNSSSDAFLSHLIPTLKTLETLPSGAKLLRLLERGPAPVVIRLGNMAFNPTVPGGRFWSGIKNSQAIHFLNTRRMSDGSVVFNQLGSGGEVLWHPTKEILSIESDDVKRPTARAVSLAHELFHAWDSVRGLLDMRFVKGEAYSFETVVEYRGVWFENQIRRELGLLYRRFYGDPNSPTDQDLLDEHGEPIYIPHGCLSATPNSTAAHP